MSNYKNIMKKVIY